MFQICFFLHISSTGSLQSCCIAIKISIIMVIQIHIQVDSVVSNTNGFINFWLQSFDMRREIQIIKAHANHTMLTSPTMRHILWCYGVISAGRDLKTQPLPSTAENSIKCLFKILIFSGPSLLGLASSTLQCHFLSGGLLLTYDDCHILSAWA